MLWIKVFHIFFMVTWFSGLFYLPRLYVYHAMAQDVLSIDRFKVMERKLYFGIATPGAILTVIFGLWLLNFNAAFFMHMKWFHFKLSLVALLFLYHIYLGYLLLQFRRDENKHAPIFYRVINEIPVLFLFAIIFLIVVRP